MRTAVSATPMPDTVLRADIRLLGRLLGETLVRQEGRELLELVERVRALTKAARRASPQSASELDELLSGVDLPTAALLVKAFSAYFHLANIAEQTHRADEWGVREHAERHHRALAVLFDRLDSAGVRYEELSRASGAGCYPPSSGGRGRSLPPPPACPRR